MHDEQAFLENIRANPTDTNAWFVLADWLEERGDPRAEFIRIRLELLTIDVPDREALEERMQNLLRDGMEPLVVTETNSIGMQLVLIPPGEFLMGSPRNEKGRRMFEQRHPVRITKAFYLGIYEVTHEQYVQLMGPHKSVFDTGSVPVYDVSWHDAVAFCRRLSERENKSYGLPTEAQWEYACRAGTTTPFPYGKTLSRADANYYSEDEYLPESYERGPAASEGLTPVGSYRPNGWGLYDMLGNVSEWCADRADCDSNYYRHSPVEDPPGPDSALYRILRGGDPSGLTAQTERFLFLN